MIFKKTIFLLFILFLLGFQKSSDIQINFSKIHPKLQEVLLNTPNDAMVDVYIMLRDRYPLESIIQQTNHLHKKEKQTEIVRILKEFATEKQHAVLILLNDAERHNEAINIRILWATNTIVFSGTPDLIYSLANHLDEIKEIRYDQKININLADNITQSPPFLNESINPGITLINADDVWAEGYFGQGVFMASIDEGCDWDHPDLIDNMWNNLGEDYDNDGHTIELSGDQWILDPGDLNGVDDDNNGYIDDLHGWDFVNDDNLVDGNWHGTCTAGIAVGDGTMGTQTGVAPQAKLVNLKIGTNAEQQQTYCWLAMQYAIDIGVDVITHSQSFHWDGWGGGSDPPDVAMFRDMAVLELEVGIIHFTSISNDGNTIGVPFNISTPGNCPPPWLHPDQTIIGGLSSIMGVGNVDANTDVIHSTSPYGPSSQEDYSINNYYPYTMPEDYWDYPYETLPNSPGLLKPDISSPGANTKSLGGSYPDFNYRGFNGTSGATPHAAGTAALMLSVHPDLTPSDISRLIQMSSIDKGVPGHDNRYGAGRIDAYEAYLLVLGNLPVELSNFTANVIENSVLLKWETETELNNYGFNVERSVNGKAWRKIGFVEGKGTTTIEYGYSFKDNEIKAGNISYRLKQIDFDGRFKYSNEIEIVVTALTDYKLHQNYPNPFNPTTNIKYSISKEEPVTISIFNITGEKVALLVNEKKTIGNYEVEFDGNNLPSGVYLYKIRSGKFVDVKKMMLLK